MQTSDKHITTTSTTSLHFIHQLEKKSNKITFSLREASRNLPKMTPVRMDLQTHPWPGAPDTRESLRAGAQPAPKHTAETKREPVKFSPLQQCSVVTLQSHYSLSSHTAKAQSHLPTALIPLHHISLPAAPPCSYPLPSPPPPLTILFSLFPSNLQLPHNIFWFILEPENKGVSPAPKGRNKASLPAFTVRAEGCMQPLAAGLPQLTLHEGTTITLVAKNLCLLLSQMKTTASHIYLPSNQMLMMMQQLSQSIHWGGVCMGGSRRQ